MSVFRDFFVKEKPVFTGIARGVGGFAFGSGGAGGGGPSAIPVEATGGTKIPAATAPNGFTYHIFANSGALNKSLMPVILSKEWKSWSSVAAVVLQEEEDLAEVELSMLMLLQS